MPSATFGRRRHLCWDLEPVYPRMSTNDPVRMVAIGGLTSISFRTRQPHRHRADGWQTKECHMADLAELGPGEVFAGRYVIQRVLGEGNRKRTYLANDTKMDRPWLCPS